MRVFVFWVFKIYFALALLSACSPSGGGGSSGGGSSGGGGGSSSTPTALLAISDSGYSYGTKNIGSNSDKTFTLTNSGTATATAIQEMAGSELAAPFTFPGGFPGGGTCQATLAAGATCQFVVRFTPASGGSHSDIITLSYGNGEATTTVTRTISGIGDAAVLSISASSSANFGEVYVGTKIGRAKQEFTVTNNGSATATVMSGGGLAAPFGFLGGSYPGQGGSCGSSLAASASCTIVLTFRPNASGSASDSVEVSYDDGAGPQTASLALSGTGIRATQVSAGANHTCAVLSSGKVKCWGNNQYGQLGNGEAEGNLALAVTVTCISTATAVAAGAQHTCALLADSTVKCWGADKYGQLGDGAGASETCTATACETTPVSVSGISNATSIAAAAYYSCARLADSTIKCWGVDWSEQLGGGTGSSTTCDGSQCEPSPVLVSGINTATAVATGSEHACALLSDSTIKCWGDDSEGQLGDDGVRSDKANPVAVSGINNATQLSLGSTSSCARLADSTMKCWGNDEYGQLGDDAGLVDQLTPVAVASINNATSVSLGTQSACARLADSTIKCWGRDNQGQLGDSLAATDQATPVVVANITDALAVSVGPTFGCALRSDFFHHVLGK